MAEKQGSRIDRLLEFEKNAILTLPRISLFGNLQCCVEQHQGILQYIPERVGIQAGSYRIYIEGTDLVITSLSEDEVYVEGKIGQVRYDL